MTYFRDPKKTKGAKIRGGATVTGNMVDASFLLFVNGAGAI